MSLTPAIEAAALRESEDALRELITAFTNIGLTKDQVALMLREVADELSPPITLQ
mgnify:CR=1 FL=1